MSRLCCCTASDVDSAYAARWCPVQASDCDASGTRWDAASAHCLDGSVTAASGAPHTAHEACVDDGSWMLTDGLLNPSQPYPDCASLVANGALTNDAAQAQFCAAGTVYAIHCPVSCQACRPPWPAPFECQDDPAICASFQNDLASDPGSADMMRQGACGDGTPIGDNCKASCNTCEPNVRSWPAANAVAELSTQPTGKCVHGREPAHTQAHTDAQHTPQ